MSLISILPNSYFETYKYRLHRQERDTHIQKERDRRRERERERERERNNYLQKDPQQNYQQQNNQDRKITHSL